MKSLFYGIFIFISGAAFANEDAVETAPTISPPGLSAELISRIGKMNQQIHTRATGRARHLRKVEIDHRELEWDIEIDRLFSQIRQFPGLEEVSWRELQGLLFDYSQMSDEEFDSVFDWQDWDDEEDPPILEKMKILIGLIEIDPLAEFSSLTENQHWQFLSDHFDEDIFYLDSMDDSETSALLAAPASDSDEPDIVWKNFSEVYQATIEQEMVTRINNMEGGEDHWRAVATAEKRGNHLGPNKDLVWKKTGISPEVKFGAIFGLSLWELKRLFPDIRLRPIEKKWRKQHIEQINQQLRVLLADAKKGLNVFFEKYIHRDIVLKISFLEKALGLKGFRKKFKMDPYRIRELHIYDNLTPDVSSALDTVTRKIIGNPRHQFCVKAIEQLNAIQIPD